MCSIKTKIIQPVNVEKSSAVLFHCVHHTGYGEKKEKHTFVRGQRFVCCGTVVTECVCVCGDINLWIFTADFFQVGLWIDAGSRYENERNNGTAHFLEHMAFKVRW